MYKHKEYEPQKQTEKTTKRLQRVTKCRSFQFITYRAAVGNRITAEGWIGLNFFSSKMQKGGCFTVSKRFVGIPGAPTEDNCYENDGRQTGATPGALEQLVGLTPCLSIKWLQAKFFPNPNPPRYW